MSLSLRLLRCWELVLQQLHPFRQRYFLIFIVGSRTLKTVVYKSPYDNDGDNDFAILCSHVCQYWRAVALNTSQLWCSLDFTGYPSEEWCKVWIERSKNAPLLIDVSHTEGGRELSRAHAILDLILPHAHRWELFELVTDSYGIFWLWQRELIPLRIAPILEHIGLLYHGDQLPTFTYIYPFTFGSFPRSRSVVLWAVHFDWDLTTFFTGLEYLHLAWHEDRTIILEGSAPKPGDWPQERLLLPKLMCLTLLRISVSDATSVIDHLDFPNLVSISSGYEFAAANHINSTGELNFMLNREGHGHEKFHTCRLPGQQPIQSLDLISLTCSIIHGRLFISTLP